MIPVRERKAEVSFLERIGGDCSSLKVKSKGFPFVKKGERGFRQEVKVSSPCPTTTKEKLIVRSESMNPTGCTVACLPFPLLSLRLLYSTPLRSGKRLTSSGSVSWGDSAHAQYYRNRRPQRNGAKEEETQMNVTINLTFKTISSMLMSLFHDWHFCQSLSISFLLVPILSASRFCVFAPPGIAYSFFVVSRAWRLLLWLYLLLLWVYFLLPKVS